MLNSDMQMHHHYTPESVAVVLARHTPRVIRRILEPSVGDGILLSPIIRKVDCRRISVTALDIDAKAVDKAKKFLGESFHPSSQFIHDDFLQWATRVDRTIQYDCIVMNPPFAARKNRWVSADISHFLGTDSPRTRMVPLEVAFLVSAIPLLAPRGRLLAVLPSSVVAADGQGWFRQELLKQGTVTHVHELPHRTFPKLESRFYLLVFAEGLSARTVELRNHDLHHPEKLKAKWSVLGSTLRLDYAFSQANQMLGKLRSRASYNWKQLSEVAEILRGSVDADDRRSSAVRPADQCDGFWAQGKRPLRKRTTLDLVHVKQGDLLMKRVGRGCSMSLGLANGVQRLSCSECLFIIRPNSLAETNRLLFVFRTLMNIRELVPLLERGCGAPYITEGSLRALIIPWNLPSVYPKRFASYESCIRKKDVESMRQIEDELAQNILQKCNKEGIDKSPTGRLS